MSSFWDPPPYGGDVICGCPLLHSTQNLTTYLDDPYDKISRWHCILGTHSALWVPKMPTYSTTNNQYRESTADQVDDQSTFHWVHRHTISIDTCYRTDTIQCFHKHRIVCKERRYSIFTLHLHIKKKTAHNIELRPRPA